MSAQVTEAHLTLADQVQQGFFTMARRLEVAQLIADSEARATAELKKRADHWCDMHTVCAKEANQLRAELATCKDASEALVESLRAEVEQWELAFQEQFARAERAEADADSTRERALALANSLDEAQAELAAERAKVRVLRSAMKFIANDDNYMELYFDPCELASEALAATEETK